MHRFCLLLIFVIFLKPLKAQSNFSFNCAKDVTIECNTKCISLNTTIPDIHASTNSYVVHQNSEYSCFRGYVNPASLGTSAGLNIDDRYSAVLDIGFPFSFFGSTYNQLIASTNGFLSFDITKAGSISHFGILKNGGNLSASSGTPEDLPSSLYDKAIIMGAYHDLDPNNAVSSYQIKYDVTGTAPYRKWILTYNNVPLYTKACANTFSNTQQIVLYETLGIVEIFIYDKEVCLSWNDGRSMIGMQDFNKSSAIMAPFRSASSLPWGSKGIDESWIFVPASGSTLFKRVELYSIAGDFITAGSTIPSNNLLYVNFPNVCPPDAGGTYLVKYFYSNPNNPASEIQAIDTINISRGGDPFSADITPATSPTCAIVKDGMIKVTNPVGANVEYTIDGINWQLSNEFSLPQGTYTVQARTQGSNCVSSKIVSIPEENFDASVKTFVTPCPGPLSGTIEVTPSRGIAPYSYSLNGGAFQDSNTFTNLPAGTYNMLVKDSAGCSFATSVSISAANLASASVTNTICDKAGSGTITIDPRFGVAPYLYSINGGSFQASNVFKDLTAGVYTITLKDSTGCSATLDVTVFADALISANIDMIMPKCFGDSNGSVIVHPFAGVAPYQFAIDASSFQTDSVFRNLPQANYVLHIKDFAGCVKDSVITMHQPDPVNGTNIFFPASNCITADGQIIIKVNTGVAPYLFSIDSGKTFQSSNLFNNLVAGAYNIIVKDNNNCKLNITDTIPALDNKLQVDAGPDKTICFGSSIQLKANTIPFAAKFNWNTSTGLTDSVTATPIANPTDTTIYIVTAKTAACIGTDTIAVNILHKPTANAGADTTICTNSIATLHGTASNISGSVNYLWSPVTDFADPHSATAIVKPKKLRANNYLLEVSDNYGCNFKVYDKVTVTMNPPVPAFAGNDTIASMGVPHQLFGSGGIQYLWSPPEVLNSASVQNPVATLMNDTRFYLTVKDTMGCTGSSSVMIKVYKGVTYYVPNAFTPNRDGKNDVFRVIAPGIQKTNYFKIFNRWGQLMFETQDTKQGWDGTYLNVLQPTSVYIWIIKGVDMNGKIIELKGSVTLIR